MDIGCDLNSLGKFRAAFRECELQPSMTTIESGRYQEMHIIRCEQV